MALKFITPVVVLHVDVQAHFKLLSVFISGQTLITSTTYHCAAQSHSVPVCPGWLPFPQCTARLEESHDFSVQFPFASFSLSFSLFRFQSLSLSLTCICPHSCCIMFHAIGISLKYLIIACFLSVTVSIPVFFSVTSAYIDML